MASSGNRLAYHTIILAGLLAVTAASAWQGDGWAWRFPSLSLSAEQISQGKSDRFRLVKSACTLENARSNKNCNFEAKLQMLVLGNSVEVDGFNFIQAAFGDDTSLNFIEFGGISKCSDWREEFDRFLTSDASCQQRLDTLFEPAMISRLDVVLYSANIPYGENKDSLLAILQKLKSLNPKIKILTFGGYINTKRPCAFYINKTNTTDACALPENVSYFEDDPTDDPLFSQFRAIESLYIDRVDLLCKNRVLQTCRTRTDDGIPFSYDGVHSSLEFSQMSGKMYAKKNRGLLHNLSGQ